MGVPADPLADTGPGLGLAQILEVQYEVAERTLEQSANEENRAGPEAEQLDAWTCYGLNEHEVGARQRLVPAAEAR